MIEWRDEGALLAVRRHGEGNAIVEVFTAAHGRHLGVVRGGGGRRLSPILQPGAQLDVTWSARLEDHLGAFRVEPIRSRAALVMGDPLALKGLTAICALMSFLLPEREPHPELYARTTQLLDLLGRTEAWPLAYLRWELAVLAEMGFALDLETCAVSGATEDLAFVSPKSGRAVSRAAAGDWAPRLLPLPPVLRGAGEDSDPEIAEGLELTGYFLEHRLAPSLGDKPVPAARARLVEALRRR